MNKYIKINILEKFLLLFFTAILLLFSVADASVRTINVPGMNTYRMCVLDNGHSDEVKIIGTTYDFDIYAIRPNGKILWQDKLGGFCFALAVADLTGNGKEEIIAGCGDDSLHCYRNNGQRLWSVGLNSGAIFSVATIISQGKNYVLAGTALNDLFVIDSNGTVVTRHRFKGAVRQILVDDFDGDGRQDVFICKTVRSDNSAGEFFRFPSMESMSGGKEFDLKINRNDHGMNGVVVRNENNAPMIFYNKGYVGPYPSSAIETYNNKGFNIIKDIYADSYRSKLIAAGKYLPKNHASQIAIAYGDEIFLYNINGKLLGYTRSKLSFNDVVTLNEGDGDKILLSGAPNGDDNLYILSPDLQGKWMTKLAFMEWSGRMSVITETYKELDKNLAVWKGEPMPASRAIIVQINGEQGNGLNEQTMDGIIANLKREHDYYRKRFPYPERIKFASRIILYEDFGNYYRYRKPDGTWMNKPGSDNTYKALSRETIIAFARKMEAAGVNFYTKAHGVQVSPETYIAMMEAAPTACLGIGIVEYPFLYDLEGKLPYYKGKIDYVARDFLLPLMEYCRQNGKRVWYHCKGTVWPTRTSYSYIQHGIMAEKFKDVIIMSNEDSNSRTPDLNTAARSGAWYAGYVNNWGYRWVSDIPSFSRVWDWSRTNTGHPVCRALMTAVSLGANYLNICSREFDLATGKPLPPMEDGVSQLLHMLGKGIIAAPTREELCNVSPVALCLTPDMTADLRSDSGGHEFVFREKGDQTAYASSDGFGLLSKLGNEWGCTTTLPTDWGYYAYGRRRQAHNHVPTLEQGYGYAMIVPEPVERSDIDISYFTTKVRYNGEKLSVGDNEVLALAEGRRQIEQAMERGTRNSEMFPFLIRGEVFSSITRMSDDKYVAYLIDPGLFNPADRKAEIQLNTKGEWNLSDRITGEPLGELETKLTITISAGSFRLLDIIRNRHEYLPQSML